MDGGISFIEACERLDSQFDTLTRETTQSSGVSCGESSSVSVAAPESLKSQACSFPVSPVEPHMLSTAHLICASGNSVHRSSAKTRTENNERVVATTPSIDTRLPIRSLTCSERLPWQLWRSRNTRRHSTPLSASGTRTIVRDYPVVLALSSNDEHGADPESTESSQYSCAGYEPARLCSREAKLR